jgi:hypothetical protein
MQVQLKMRSLTKLMYVVLSTYVENDADLSVMKRGKEPGRRQYLAKHVTCREVWSRLIKVPYWSTTRSRLLQ